MDIDEFERRVGEFASEIRELLDACLPGNTQFKNARISSDTLRASFGATKKLDIRSSDRASLVCGYNLCANSTGRHIAVEASSFSLEYQANSRPVPVVRFEYDRNANSKPVSHFHFHSDSVPLGLMLARAGKHEDSAQQQNLHFPMGGHRYRVCLEDIIELVIREFNAESLAGWEARVKEGRRDYRKRQAETIISENTRLASEILEEIGFRVSPPAGYEYPPADDSCEW